jgi:anaerobic selenocysteine-containing dehydrogenase
MRFSPRLLFHSVALSNGKMLRTVDRHEHGLRLAQHEPASFLGKAVPTANGRVQLAPSALLSLAERLAISFEQKTREQRGLLLIGQRDKTSHNSWMHNVASFVQGNRSTNYLTMHPDDAKLLRIDPFQIAEVETSVGRVRLPVKISREIMPGVVALPHGWGHERAEGLSVASQTTGANANGLTPDGSAAIEPLSGMAQLTAIPVAVKPWLGRSLSDPPPPTDPSGESERFVDLH